MRVETQDQKATGASDDDYRLLAAWRDVLRDFMVASKHILRQSGVTSNEYQALLVIRLQTQHQKVSVGDLARHLRIRNNSAVSLLNRMTRQSLARRVPSEDDARIMYLRLTAKGDALLRKLVVAHRRELDRISQSLRDILT
jgi:DNA-binding MarR family transcriptional regulator